MKIPAHESRCSASVTHIYTQLPDAFFALQTIKGYTTNFTIGPNGGGPPFEVASQTISS